MPPCATKQTGRGRGAWGFDQQVCQPRSKRLSSSSPSRGRAVVPSPSPSLTPSRPASEEAAGRPWCSSDCSKPRWGPLTLILTPGGKKATSAVTLDDREAGRDERLFVVSPCHQSNHPFSTVTSLVSHPSDILQTGCRDDTRTGWKKRIV